MEAVFKLTRAEVEEACAQYLMRRDVRFAQTPKLADNSGQDFEHLFFTGEIALAPARPVAVPAAAPPLDLVDMTKVFGDPAAPVLAPVRATTPPAVESKLDFNGGSAQGQSPGAKVTLGSLFAPDEPPATAKLPASVIAYRASNPG